MMTHVEEKSYRKVVILGDTQTSIFNSPYCWLYQHAASTVANASLRVRSTVQRSPLAFGRLARLRRKWAYRLHPSSSVGSRISMRESSVLLRWRACSMQSGSVTARTYVPVSAGTYDSS